MNVFRLQWNSINELSWSHNIKYKTNLGDYEVRYVKNFQAIVFAGKKNLTQTKDRFEKYIGTVQISIVKKCFAKFRCDRTFRTSNWDRYTIILEIILNKVLANRRLKVHEIAKPIGTSLSSVVLILDEHLCIRKLSAKWALHLLTMDQKIIGWPLRRSVRVCSTPIQTNFYAVSPQHTGDQRAVETEGLPEPITAKEGLSAKKPSTANIMPNDWTDSMPIWLRRNCVPSSIKTM